MKPFQSSSATFASDPSFCQPSFLPNRFLRAMCDVAKSTFFPLRLFAFAGFYYATVLCLGFQSPEEGASFLLDGPIVFIESFSPPRRLYPSFITPFLAPSSFFRAHILSSLQPMYPARPLSLFSSSLALGIGMPLRASFRDPPPELPPAIVGGQVMVFCTGCLFSFPLFPKLFSGSQFSVHS